MSRQLGRIVAPDERDEQYLHPLAAARMPMPRPTDYRYWSASFNLDQTGDSCVANGWTHFLGDFPVSHKIAALDALHPGYVSAQSGQAGFRGWLYDWAQAHDEFSDTPPAGGTSVRAGAKGLQSAWEISEYHWLTTSTISAANLAAVAQCVLTQSPVVIGTDWYEQMMNVPAGGWLKCEGGVVGGHCTVLDGVNVAYRKFRVQTWGVRFWASFDTIERLLSDGGEACVASEVA